MAYDLPLRNREVGVIALKNILVATDFSEPSEAALKYGIELARRFEATLHVLHVVDDLAAHRSTTPVWVKDIGAAQTELEATARATLSSLLPEPDRTAVRAQLQIVVSATPGPAILSYARDAVADLIIVGTHGRHGLERLVLGSVAQHVARLAECPVLVVRAHQRGFVVDAAP
jgi:nucleotide-binding universal stress UspA family protein